MAFDFNSLAQATNLYSNLGGFQKHEILTVSSLQQVKDFIINKGDSYLLLDPNSDLLYIKEADNLGKIKISIFRLTDVTNEIMDSSTPVTLSKSQFDNLMKRLEQLEGGKNGTSKSEHPEQPELGL